jgi:hypothetical protein
MKLSTTFVTRTCRSARSRSQHRNPRASSVLSEEGCCWRDDAGNGEVRRRNRASIVCSRKWRTFGGARPCFHLQIPTVRPKIYLKACKRD